MPSKPEPQTYAEVVVPDSIEPLYGWKALEITPDGRLASPQQKIVWPVKKRLEAVCNNTNRQVHYEWKAVYGEGKPMGLQQPPPGTVVTATSTSMVTSSMHIPDKPRTLLPAGMSWSWEPIEHEIASNNCRCGIYVVNDPRQCQSYLNQNCVLAEVCLWGRVVPASDGARGEFAYPRQLFAPDTLTDVATMVAQLYGIPIGYRDHQTGATITYREAMENLARLKAGLNKPFVQKKHPTTIPKAAAPPPPPVMVPTSTPQLVPKPPLSEQELARRQARKKAQLAIRLAWFAVLILWTLSFTLTPLVLIAVLPLFLLIAWCMETVKLTTKD